MKRLTACGLSCLVLVPASLVWGEDFDQAGDNWASTIFPELARSGDGTFERAPLTTAQGAPDTSPPLPINAGSDKEGRYYDAGVAPSGSYALMADVPENVVSYATIDGYVAIGNPDPFGSRTVAFLLRAQDSGRNSYAVMISHGEPDRAGMSIVRIRNGIVGGGSDRFAVAEPFTVDVDAENYRVVLRAGGQNLAASIWRVHVVDGTVVETPIDLLAKPGVQNTLRASDDELAEGRAGFRAFARGDNSIFWDDVEVDRCPFDLDDSGIVGFGDLVALLAAWGDEDGAADLDVDGLVGFGDLTVLLANWGACP